MRMRGAFAVAVFLAGALPLAAQQQPTPDGFIDPAAPEARPDRPPANNLPTRTIETPDDRVQPVIAPVLTVDQDALFTASAWGQRVAAELDRQGTEIAAENERLTDQLAAEEADLARRRPELEPADFRDLAEAFDSRATTIRRERAQVVQELNARAEADRAAFYQAALPIMGEMMVNRGAVAVLDRRTVFVSSNAIDITDELIQKLDEALGDGAGRPGTMGATEGDAPTGPAEEPAAD